MPRRRRRLPGRPRSRAGLATLAAGASLLAAAIAVIGPATPERATYAWPPAQIPLAEPETTWYSPLLVARHVPESLAVRIPCPLGPPLAADGPLTVVATARDPAAAGGLSVTREGTALRFRVGGDVVAETPPSGEACTPATFRIDRGAWRLEAGRRVSSGYIGTERPVVTGLFTGIDLARGAGPEVTVTTEPYGVRTTWVQRVAAMLAVAGALVALGLLVGARRPRLRAGRALRSVGLVDAFVAVAVLVWWFVGPTLFDDGWVKARQLNYAALGEFSAYYGSFGSTFAMDYWAEWLQRWPVAHLDSVLAARLPAVLLLGAGWILCRWTLRRLLGAEESAGTRWALGLTFVLFATAWGVTVRPEPLVAVLAGGVLACAVSFVERPAAPPLVLASVLVVLSVTAHPIGVVAVAPLVSIAPQLWAWGRERRWLVLAAIALAASALLVVLSTLGSDLAQRSEEARLARTFPESVVSWREELERYLLPGNGSTPVRRLSVALMLAGLATVLLVRADRRSRALHAVPAVSLAVGMLLLVPTPSKWPWHFGAFGVVAPLVLAVAVAHLQSGRRSLRPLIAIGATVLIISWSWFPRASWGTLDLRTLDWTLALEGRITLMKLLAVLPLVALAALAAVALARQRDVVDAPRRLVPWLVPLAAAPALVFTVAVLTADAVKTPGWTLARQNVETLTGNAGCGLADDTVVAAPRTMAALMAPGQAPVPPAWVPPPPVAGAPVYTVPGPDLSESVETPWFAVPRERRVGLFALASFAGTLEARWRSAGSTEEDWGSAPVPASADAEHVPWTFVPEASLPPRPADATAVQLRLRTDATPPQALAITGPVSYRTTTLTHLLSSSPGRPLVWPNVLLFTPCVELPRLADGLVEPPSLLVAHSGLWPVAYDSSPFHGLIDLYGFRDLSVGDSSVPPEGLSAIWVDRAPPGAALAPAVRVDA